MKKVQATLVYGMLQASMWAIHAVLISFASNFLSEAGLKGGAVSLVLGVSTALAVVLQLVLAEVLGRSRRIPLQGAMMAMAAVMIGGTALMLFAPTPWNILGQSLAAICMMALPGFVNSVGVEAIERGIPIVFGISRGFGSLFYSISSTVTGILMERMGMPAMPAMAAGLTLLFALCCLLTWKFCGPTLGTGEKKQKTHSGGFLTQNKGFAVVLAASVLFYLCHNLVANFLFYIIQDRGGAADDQGIAAALSAVVELPVLFCFGYMTKKVPCRRWVELSGVFFAAKSVALLLSPSVGWVIAAQVLQIGGNATYLIASVRYAAEAVPGDPIRAQSYLGATSTVASVVSMSIGGLLCERLGVNAMLMVSLIAGVLGTLLMFFAVEKSAVTLNTKTAKM